MDDFEEFEEEDGDLDPIDEEERLRLMKLKNSPAYKNLSEQTKRKLDLRIEALEGSAEALIELSYLYGIAERPDD